VVDNLYGEGGSLNDYSVELILELYDLVVVSWSDLSSCEADNWSTIRASLGQGLATALLVQARLGGDIVKVIVDCRDHYYNRIDGTDVDLARDQFDTFDPSGRPVIVDYGALIANCDTLDKFEQLARCYNEQVWGGGTHYVRAPATSGILPYYARGMDGSRSGR
jgi:hypothetical protein